MLKNLTFIIFSLMILLVFSSHNKKFEDFKSKYRYWIMKHSLTKSFSEEYKTYRAIENLDDPSNFFDGDYTTKLSDLPLSASIDTPWSASYWPIQKGGLSFRYGKNTTKHSTWKEYIESYNQPSEHNKYYNTDKWDYIVNQVYSPAEKYDLLVGDYDYTLTNSMKDEGNYVDHDSDGDVPGWMGKCHGWTPASIFEPRPVKTVSLTASDGKTNIDFYPEDIRALATCYWAEAKFKTKFLGDRCDYADIDKIPSDPDTGLWDDYKCFTVNPASLVIVVANQLGIKKKAFIYDPDSNGQIWNQPVYSYKLSFFDIFTKKSEKFNKAIKSLDEVKSHESDDVMFKFLIKKASKKTSSLIGAKLEIQFSFENPPVFGDKTMDDNTDSRKYTLYLELDEENNVIGGEWPENQHPIFIWLPAENSKIRGLGDDIVKTFKGSVSELNKLSSEAKKVSKKNAVLGAIVHYLVNKSSADNSLEFLG